ncbi:MAG TPA: hypothetical protein VGS57_18950 [Thermoanaerobaculia bacterium]|jgi:hypothetical protein|nr:hypothetical protein [Thermoanaerobaculia bacterium]
MRLDMTTATTTTTNARRLFAALMIFAVALMLGAPTAAWSAQRFDGATLAKIAGLKSGGDGGGDDGGGGGGGGGHDTLKLRLNDAVGKPGGMVALVIRTYAARPLRQGRITVRVHKSPAKALGIAAEAVANPARPLTFVRGIVFSAADDAVTTTSTSNAVDSQSASVQFHSNAAAVNAADGPLAVLFFRLDNNAAPGSVYDLDIDPAATGLTDPSGAAVTVEPLQGQLRVRTARAPYELGAEGDELAPGEVAEMGVETAEPFAVFGGQVTLRWDPAAQGGAPAVRMDPRYGKSTYRIERSVPGELVVSFTSPKGLLNSVPGRFLAVALPTSASAPLGWSSSVTIDASRSWLLDKRGKKLAVSFEAGSLDFR